MNYNDYKKINYNDYKRIEAASADGSGDKLNKSNGGQT